MLWFHVAAAVVPALVVAPTVIRHMRRLSRTPPGRGRLVAGLVLLTGTAAAYVLIGFLFALFFLKPLVSARVVAQKAVCQERLRTLSRALLVYAQDWDERLPPAAEWSDWAADNLNPGDPPNLFQCPAAATAFGYGFNRHLGGACFFDFPNPGNIVLLADCDTAVRSGVVDSGGVARRHSVGFNAAFADGHTRWINDYSESRLEWLPAYQPSEPPSE
jgi:prepilin-type processing-associated H-X9-DG protein